MGDVKILNASLDEDENGDMVIRGIVEQESLKFIGMAWYQRERGFSQVHINEIISAYYSGSQVADITIGMRGERLRQVKADVVLLDKCYCINGGQRLYAASVATEKQPDLKIRVGAKVHFNTTEESENERFCIENTTQVTVSPSILIRNRKKKSPASNLLLLLNGHPEFALKDKVAWDQRKKSGDLIMGFTIVKTVAALHCHVNGGLRNNKPFPLLAALDVLVDKIGEANVRTNTIRFFDVIDKCFGIRQLSGTRNELRPHLSLKFLKTIALLFSSYSEFWDGNPRHEFYCGEKYVRKLKGFPLQKFTMSSAIPDQALFEVLRKHIGLDPRFEEPQAAE